LPEITEAIAYNQRTFTEDLPISAAELRQNFLFGVDLKDGDGNEMPDSLIEFYIRSAVHWLEREIGGLAITPTTITNERHDYHTIDYTSYSFIKLFRFPVRSVQEVNVLFPLATKVINFDPSWFQVESSAAQVNLVPTRGTLSTIIVSAGGSYFPLIYSNISYIPHIFQVGYKAGFEKGKIPPDILELIGMKASMGPLNIAGDLIAGAGIATKSISLDGLSQSIGTTSSATNSGYGARILQYGKEIQSRLGLLRNNLAGIQMVVG